MTTSVRCKLRLKRRGLCLIAGACVLLLRDRPPAENSFIFAARCFVMSAHKSAQAFGAVSYILEIGAGPTCSGLYVSHLFLSRCHHLHDQPDANQYAGYHSVSSDSEKAFTLAIMLMNQEHTFIHY